MRILQFCCKNGPKVARLGVQLGENGDLVDLSQMPDGFPSTMEFLKAAPESQQDLVKRAIDSGKFRLSPNEVELLAPITGPDKVICIGMNYVDHCLEQNMPVPKEPVVFNKFPSSLVGPYQDIPYPDVTQELDWEVELAVVIGHKGKDIEVKDAMDHVFGYTVAHDVSARDWQLKRNGGQWLVGKTMDAFCPIGPAIVSKSEVPDPHNLNLKCLVNGETMQNSSTNQEGTSEKKVPGSDLVNNQLVFKIDELVSWCSKFFTLLPGDVILTGTPPGVGVFMKPPKFLKRGDVVECYIEKIGQIKNAIV